VAITARGQSSLLDGLTVGQSDGASVVLSRPFDDGSHALLAVRYDNGYWVKVSDTVYRNATRRFAPEAQDSIWSAKFAKTLTGPLAPWQRVVGHELELVPLRNPAEIKRARACGCASCSGASR
jgi:nickel transport protein